MVPNIVTYKDTYCDHKFSSYADIFNSNFFQKILIQIDKKV